MPLPEDICPLILPGADRVRFGHCEHLLVKCSHPVIQDVNVLVASAQPDYDPLGSLINEAHLANLVSTLLQIPGAMMLVMWR